MDIELLPLIITDEDQKDFGSLIDQLISLLYTNENLLTTYLHSEVPDVISHFLQSRLLPLPTIQSKEQWLKNLREDISSFEKMTITTAFCPSRNFLENVLTKVRSQYSPSIVIESRYKPEIIAGVEITYKGIYQDLTIGTKVATVLEEMKSKLL
jgi:F0F1-type ATP synthase delta subunit